MKVGYLGPKNSFTYQATDLLFSETKKIPYSTIPFVIEALENNEVEYAVVPIENSLEGSVHASVDKIFKVSDIYIDKELVLPIKQQFMMEKGYTHPEKIMSHPQALAQSQAFLKNNYPDVPIIPTPSTTYAAEYICLHPEQQVAAIASEKAAQAFNLTILHNDIQDNDQNQTRFWLLSKQAKVVAAEASSQQLKMTLFCTLPANHSGALHQILAAFAWREIDLAKIESRPLKTSLGQYYFIIDLNVSDNIDLIYYALEEIARLGTSVKSMGPYVVVQAN